MLAVVGSTVHDLALQVLGPGIALGIHMWSEYRASKARKEEASLLEHLKLQNWQLESELAKLRGPQTDGSKCGYTGRDCMPRPKH